MDLIQKMFSKETSGSKEIAKERLRLVLVHDRIDSCPQIMEILKEDMIKVISNYMEVSEKDMEVVLLRPDLLVSLVASVPVNRTKRGVISAD